MIKNLILLFIVILTLFSAWKIFGGNTNFKEDQYFLYIKTGSNYESLIQALKEDRVIRNPAIFSWVAERVNLPSKLKAGRYKIEKSASIWQIVQILRNGIQAPVNLIITKLRTKEDLARIASRKLECDSASIINLLNNSDSLLKIGVDTHTVMTLVIPNSYSFFWNTSADQLMHRLFKENEKFWREDRLQKAQKLGLSPQQVYILASIIEEETNKFDEMPIMASVYLNRINRGMPLGADPTIKYAIRDFAARRVTLKMITQSASSPYNTYKNKGLPPGPICTPSIKTIDATLDAATTSYLYFCAKADFSGYHSFATTESEHFKNARAYQKALNRLNIK